MDNNSKQLVTTAAPNTPPTEDERKEREWKVRLGQQMVRRELAKRLSVLVPEQYLVNIVDKHQALRIAEMELRDAVDEAVPFATRAIKRTGHGHFD